MRSGGKRRTGRKLRDNQAKMKTSSGVGRERDKAKTENKKKINGSKV